MIELNDVELELLPKLITHLRDLGKEKVSAEPQNQGICRELYRKFPGIMSRWYLYEIVDYRRYLFFSGDDTYPIEHPENGNSTLGYQQTLNKWEGEYGDRRKQLCLYIADYLETNY